MHQALLNLHLLQKTIYFNSQKTEQRIFLEAKPDIFHVLSHLQTIRINKFPSSQRRAISGPMSEGIHLNRTDKKMAYFFGAIVFQSEEKLAQK